MIQGIIIAVMFSLALIYIVRMFYNSLFVKKGCGSNCKCSVDLSAMDNVKPAANKPIA